MNLNDLFNEEKVRLDPKCWTGKKIGNPKTKMKGGVRVNNCVPAESVNEMDKSQTPPGRDGSNDSDAGKKEYTAKPTTAKKVAKDGEKILNKELNKKQGVAEDQLDEKSVSQAQFRTMAAAAHNPEFAKKVGISQDVAKEFHSADKNSNYKKLPDRTNEEGERGRGRPMAGDWDPTSGKVGRVEKTPTGVRHHADPSRYGGTEQEPELDALNKNTINAMDRALGVKWDRESKKYFSPLKVDMDEGEQQKGADYRDPPEADYGDDYQDMVARVKKLAGLGPLKTVYDPAKRVYRNVPTAVQPKK